MYYEVIWLDPSSHVLSLNQSECIISYYSSYSTLNFLYEIATSDEVSLQRRQSMFK